MDISKMMKKKEAKGVFTLKRNDVAREELRIRSLEVASWLASTLGNDSMKTIQESDTFFCSLQDGVILCQLIEKVAKDVSIKYRSDAKAQTFHARENITHFLEASKKLGVPSVSLFEADDLVARKNDKAVVNALLQLSRVTAKKYNIEPPTMIKYELEIEEEQNKKEQELKEGKDEKDKSDGDESPKQSPQQSPKRSPKHQLPQEEDSPKQQKQQKIQHEEDEVDEGQQQKQEEEELQLLSHQQKQQQQEEQKEQEQDDDETPLSSKTIQPQQKQQKEQKVQLSEKLPFHFLPYIPKQGSDIDQVVAKALNDNLLDVDIKQLQIKNKKRRRDTKHKGEYLVNGHRVHVRMLQGVLVARHLNEWLNFVRFVQEQLGFVDE